MGEQKVIMSFIPASIFGAHIAIGAPFVVTAHYTEQDNIGAEFSLFCKREGKSERRHQGIIYFFVGDSQNCYPTLLLDSSTRSCLAVIWHSILSNMIVDSKLISIHRQWFVESLSLAPYSP